MATRSGLIYRKADPEEIDSAAMEETLKSMKKMMQQLMEDRRKREEEFASSVLLARRKLRNESTKCRCKWMR